MPGVSASSVHSVSNSASRSLNDGCRAGAKGAFCGKGDRLINHRLMARNAVRRLWRRSKKFLRRSRSGNFASRHRSVANAVPTSAACSQKTDFQRSRTQRGGTASGESRTSTTSADSPSSTLAMRSPPGCISPSSNRTSTPAPRSRNAASSWTSSRSGAEQQRKTLGMRDDLLVPQARGRACARRRRVLEDPRRPGGLPHIIWLSCRADSTGLRRASAGRELGVRDRKSTRLNSSHLGISYAVFCLKKEQKLPPSTGREIHVSFVGPGQVLIPGPDRRNEYGAPGTVGGWPA